jgi:hypothetical protein
MGYRSDVMAVFYARDLPKSEEHQGFNERNRAKLKLFMSENFPESWRGETESNLGDDGLTMLDKPNRLIFEFKVTDVKWYEGYKDVIAFEQFWDKFRELVEAEPEGDDPCDWAGEFIRLGENTDDIEERCVGDNEWLIQVSRVIDTNY